MWWKKHWEDKDRYWTRQSLLEVVASWAEIWLEEKELLYKVLCGPIWSWIYQGCTHKMKMRKIWGLSQIIAWVGVTHPGQMPLMTSTLTQNIEWIVLDGNQSNHFTYLGQSERDFCALNHCFLSLMKVQKLLTNNLKDTSANSDLSRVVLCLHQTAAWTSAMPRPSLITHTEVILLHVYITVKTGRGV